MHRLLLRKQSQFTAKQETFCFIHLQNTEWFSNQESFIFLITNSLNKILLKRSNQIASDKKLETTHWSPCSAMN